MKPTGGSKDTVVTALSPTVGLRNPVRLGAGAWRP